MRDGATVLEGAVADHDRDAMVEAMVGRRVDSTQRPEAASSGSDTASVVRLRNLASERAFSEVSLDLRPGEIVALYGRVGAGTQEVAEAIYGVRETASGTIEMGGQVVAISGPADAIRSGVGLLAGDRQREGALDEPAGRREPLRGELAGAVPSTASSPAGERRWPIDVGMTACTSGRGTIPGRR